MTDDPQEPAPAESPGHSKTPAALALSCAFGALGVVLIFAGLATSADAAFLAGLVAGVVSLSAALFWRSELVSSWADRKRATRS
ncbi:MAG: hypothetical protein M3P85_10420 [Actinomycetota bacterium]|nr:hypothetical protein [Actinomycetota bacterium]